MPLEAPLPGARERAAGLNARYRHHAAADVLAHALADPEVGKVALVSSFGAESVVLLHMLSIADRTTPVLFVDTGMLFRETLDYQLEVAWKLGLTEVHRIHTGRADLFAGDPEGLLHRYDANACCDLRKARPLARALTPFDAWVTGRKRFQGGARAALDFFEADGEARIKVNPLAHWTREDVADYMVNNRLPRHPLLREGYTSIGCAPCTTPTLPGEDPRAGRWRGKTKDECGIHFAGGSAVRTGKETPMTLVTDKGFGPDDWPHGFTPLQDLAASDAERPRAVDVPSDTDPAALAGRLAGIALIRIEFPSFSDGRGFTIAARLRRMGYRGRLRAKGHVIADQYAMARRAGFDEVEIDDGLAARQPEDQWLRRAEWQAHDYRARLRA